MAVVIGYFLLSAPVAQRSHVTAVLSVKDLRDQVKKHGADPDQLLEAMHSRNPKEALKGLLLLPPVEKKSGVVHSDTPHPKSLTHPHVHKRKPVLANEASTAPPDGLDTNPKNVRT